MKFDSDGTHQVSSRPSLKLKQIPSGQVACSSDDTGGANDSSLSANQIVVRLMLSFIFRSSVLSVSEDGDGGGEAVEVVFSSDGADFSVAEKAGGRHWPKDLG